MAKSMSTELHRLGVPFFETKPHLIDKVGDGGPVQEWNDGKDRMGIGGKRIGQQELVQLQRRMLEMLEDICPA